MFQLFSSLSSSRLGSVQQDHPCGYGLRSVKSRGNISDGHELGANEVKHRDYQEPSEPQDHCGVEFLSQSVRIERRLLCEGSMEGVSVGEAGGSSSTVHVSQRAHVERLQMVGAVDTANMEAIRSDGKEDGLNKSRRSHWDFSGLPFSLTGSKRSMTVQEVQLIQSIGQGVICTDLKGNITSWNRAAESIYLWTAEEVLGRNVVQLLTPQKSVHNDEVEVVGKVSHGESWSGPYPAVRKDGVIINTVVTDTPIVDQHNKIIGIVGISFDLGSMPVEKKTHRRSYSDADVPQDIVKEPTPATGSDDGKSLLTWRRVLLDEDPQPDERLPEDNSNAASSNSFLSFGRSSVQSLLRKLHIGAGVRPEEKSKSLGDSENNKSVFHSGRSIEHSDLFPVFGPIESVEVDSGEEYDSFMPLCVTKPPVRGDSGSFENLGKSINIPQLVNFHQTLSRSSSGSPPSSVTAPDTSGSAMDRVTVDHNWNTSGSSLNFLQAEEDFQLQLAVALRVAAEAAAVDDPDLSSHNRSHHGATSYSGGSKTEATAYRYWVSNCLSYDDRIDDGFYEIWGMSPYIWSMCTDTNEQGRMPPLDNLRAVPANDASLEVILVDRNMDPTLRELEEKAVCLAYQSSDILDMASELSIMVADVMGGPANSDEDLQEAWKAASSKLMLLLSSIVLPIGVLRIGLSRHRALLFKVMADSVGLLCRIVRGSALSSEEDSASVVVKSDDNKEWMVDLLVDPGTRRPPDKRLAALPTVIPTPLQYERQNPFAGSSISVQDWSRAEQSFSEGGRPKPRSTPDGMLTVTSPRNVGSANKTFQVSQGLDFQPSDGHRGVNNHARGSNDDGSKGKYGFVDLLDRPGLWNPTDPQSRTSDVGKGNSFLDDPLKPPQRRESLQNAGSGRESGHSGSSVDEGVRGLDRVWAREGRRATGSDESSRAGGAGSMLDHIIPEATDFEIAWEDIVLGDRIGQGSYGKVYRADWQGSDVAVKVFLDQDLKTEALDEYKSEVAIMRRLRHPNIVLFMGAVTKPPHLSLVTEFCPRGSLYRLLHRPNRELDDRRRIRMAVDVAKGMNYLHRCSPPVVHRDLKSPNLLVDKNWTVKVCDFGLSRQKHSTFLSSKSSAGTPEWMAPEVLRNEPSDEKSDVYSFGVILWELSTLQVPWNGMNPIQVVGAVGFQHRRLPIPDHVDGAIAAVIQACWRTDARLRPSFADLMQDLRNLQQKSGPGGQPSPNSANIL